MKQIFIAIACFFSIYLHAQKTTYILFRHAEKDKTAAGSTTMNADPPLSKAGEARALRLVEVLKKYTPDLIYSTNFIRTRNTITPLATKFKKDILLYNHKDLKAFADLLLMEKDKTIAVAGHSNTTPALVNLLIKQNEYKALDESVYNKIYIVTITPQKTEVEVVEY